MNEKQRAIADEAIKAMLDLPWEERPERRFTPEEIAAAMQSKPEPDRN